MSRHKVSTHTETQREIRQKMDEQFQILDHDISIILKKALLLVRNPFTYSKRYCIIGCLADIGYQ